MVHVLSAVLLTTLLIPSHQHPVPNQKLTKFVQAEPEYASVKEIESLSPLERDKRQDSMEGQEGEERQELNAVAGEDVEVGKASEEEKNDRAALSPDTVENMSKLNPIAVDDGVLRFDEQEECYKQQNIEPPRSELENRLQMEQKTQPKSLGIKYPRKDVAYGPRTSYVRSEVKDVAHGPRTSYVRSEVLKKSGTHHQPHNGDPVEIYSLYSEPEKQSEYQMKVKNYNKPNSSDVFNVHGRVYKPVEVQPKFPVYDEDIDFHPDPLQGILDDKYWLDPLEREAVIRKYIDLAANNMMPPDVGIVKRGATEEINVKRVNSKTDLKDADARCKDVKEVVGCKECKGKGQRNNTADDCAGVSYGRKLLSFGIDEAEGPGEGKVYGLENIESNKVDEGSQRFKTNYLIRKIFSWEDGGVGEGEGEIGEDKGTLDYKQYVFHRRHILSYEENEESYDDGEESDEDLKRSDPEISEQGSIYDIPKESDQRRELYLEPDEDEVTRSKECYHHIDNVYSEPPVVEDLTKVKDNNQVFPQKYNFVDTPDKPPAYYTPNKFANILQKPLKEKPKGPKNSKEIDPNREFEVIRNETILNATLEVESEKPSNLSLASNSTSNITNIGQAKQSFMQRKDESRFANEGRHFTNVRCRPDEYLHRQLDESDGYSCKDENNGSFESEIASPSFLKDTVVNTKDDTHLSKRSREIKQRHHKGRQSFGNLKDHKYVPLDKDLDDCDCNSYKDALNTSQSEERDTKDVVEQSVLPPQENRTLRKRWDDRRMFAHKGRRSFTDLSSTKHSPVSLFQNPEDAGSGSGGANITSGPLNETKGNTTYNVMADVNTTSSTNVTNIPLSEGIANKTTLQPNNTSSHPTTRKNKEVEKEEDAVDTEIAKDIVETVISESQRNSVLGHHLGLCRRNESLGNANYGRVVPETEKVLKSVTDCIMSRLKSHLEKQSCVLLDTELLEFLKWMVLSGDSYKDYLMTMRGYRDFLPKTTHKPTTCEPPTEAVQTTCEAETPPPLLNGGI